MKYNEIMQKIYEHRMANPKFLKEWAKYERSEMKGRKPKRREETIQPAVIPMHERFNDNSSDDDDNDDDDNDDNDNEDEGGESRGEEDDDEEEEEKEEEEEDNGEGREI